MKAKVRIGILLDLTRSGDCVAEHHGILRSGHNVTSQHTRLSLMPELNTKTFDLCQNAPHPA